MKHNLLDSTQLILKKTVHCDLYFASHPGFDEFLGYLETLLPISKILLVTDNHVDPLYGQELEALLISNGYSTIKYVLESGRTYKSLSSLDNILNSLFSSNADRSTLVINLGGGVVGDIGGLVAALYFRGIRFIHMPTTLLSQVDSSIGGKVSINYNEYLNGVGHFYYPEAIWINPAFLNSLPDVELKCGLAEIIKFAVILDKPLFAYLQDNVEKIRQRDPSTLEYLVKYSAKKKVDIVCNDPTEIHNFKLFTYGHEIGHALEATFRYRGLRHGEAVAIGMQASAWISQQSGFLEEPNLLDCQEKLLSDVGLPCNMSSEHLNNWNLSVFKEELMGLVKKDKKRENLKLVWILPIRIGKGICVNDMDQMFIYKYINSQNLGS